MKNSFMDMKDSFIRQEFLRMDLARTHRCYDVMAAAAGAHPRGGPGTYPALYFQGLKKFLPLNYVICIFAACVRMIFDMWEGRASLQHGSGLTIG